MAQNYSTLPTRYNFVPDRVILPGVGAFKDAMDGLRDRGLDETVRNFVTTGNRFRDLCWDAVLAIEGYEGGIHKGLGIIDGQWNLYPVLLRTDRHARYLLLDGHALRGWMKIIGTPPF